jgi:hypothetical protein
MFNKVTSRFYSSSSNSHTFLVEKWNPPTRSKIANIGQKTEGILGVNI